AAGAAAASAAAGRSGADATAAARTAIGLAAAGTIAADAGEALRAAMPADLYEAAHSRESAFLLVVALGLEDGGASAAQRALLDNQIGPQRAEQSLKWRREIDALDPRLRLPLFELAVPALKQRPPDQIDYLLALLQKLADSDGTQSLFEYLLHRMLAAYFDRLPFDAATQIDRTQAAIDLLAIFAREGHDDDPAAHAAYKAGLDTLGIAASERTARRFETAGGASRLAGLDAALATLAPSPLTLRRKVLMALAVAMRHDRETSIAEAELFRTLAAILGCPIPPANVIG
ncbi:MAG: hypothetical protein R3305_07120, partial [Gammaproteobacteria bacterium]|nr:hypothetical protein [Gammaproteobacteria bacterium]